MSICFFCLILSTDCLFVKFLVAFFGFSVSPWTLRLLITSFVLLFISQKRHVYCLQIVGCDFANLFFQVLFLLFQIAFFKLTFACVTFSIVFSNISHAVNLNAITVFIKACVRVWFEVHRKVHSFLITINKNSVAEKTK